jgi:hypothetical protein
MGCFGGGTDTSITQFLTSAIEYANAGFAELSYTLNGGRFGHANNTAVLHTLQGVNNVTLSVSEEDPGSVRPNFTQH